MALGVNKQKVLCSLLKHIVVTFIIMHSCVAVGTVIDEALPLEDVHLIAVTSATCAPDAPRLMPLCPKLLLLCMLYLSYFNSQKRTVLMLRPSRTSLWQATTAVRQGP